MTVYVTLSQASASPVTVTVATADGTAKNGADYKSMTTTLTFAPGTTSLPVTITILAHRNGTITKYFLLVLSGANPASATLNNGTVTITGTSMLVASGTPSAIDEAPLSPATAAAVLAQARAEWVRAGVPAATLAGVRLVVTDLPGAALGDTVGHTIYLDTTAAGFGWYVGGPSAFGPDGRAVAGGPAAGRMDLFSVLLHELGHVIGLSHGVSARYGDVMLPELAAGQRHLLPEGLRSIVNPRASGAGSGVVLPAGPAPRAAVSSTVLASTGSGLTPGRAHVAPAARTADPAVSAPAAQSGSPGRAQPVPAAQLPPTIPAPRSLAAPLSVASPQSLAGVRAMAAAALAQRSGAQPWLPMALLLGAGLVLIVVRRRRA